MAKTEVDDEETHGEPQRVSAIIAFGRERAKPKSATLRRGTPKGCPRPRSSLPGGHKSRFCGLMSRWINFRCRKNLSARAVETIRHDPGSNEGGERAPSCLKKLRTTISARPPDLGCG